MRRIMLTVAYDGTNYHGSQIQPNGNSIEAELNRALSDLCGCSICVSGASRTDAGVHALSNLFVFDTQMRMDASKFSYALNTRLPEDIKVMDSKEVALDFHPRFVDTVKTYEYRIYNDTFVNPLRRLYTHHYYGILNIDDMNEAAAYLVGEHDFKSFCSINAQVMTTVRTITGLSVRKEGQEIVIAVSGTGFLYNMVRIIAGTLIEVGRGELSPIDVENILNECNRDAAGPTAPAKGLCLVKYEFI